MRPYGLGYVLIEESAEGIAKWDDFATKVLGLMRGADVGDARHYRMDERIARFIIVPGDTGKFSMGWEYPTEASFRQALADLRGAGIELNPIDEADLAVRAVVEAYQFVDPVGVRSEVFYGPHIEPIIAFQSPTGVRFVTGDQGMGHATLTVSEVSKADKFYTETMGMHLRETTFQGVSFYGTNARHHTVAAVPMLAAGAPAEINHIMFEIDQLDQVGQAMDRCLDSKVQLVTTLGKHWNDHMVSFYALTPSGWAVEYGTGGRRVNEAEWSHVYQGGRAGASYWGHRMVGPSNELGVNIGETIG